MYIVVKTGGNEWEPLTKGLPQKDRYVNVLRDAMAVDSDGFYGLYFGTTGGQVYASADSGDSWDAIVHDLPAVYSVEVHNLQLIRVILPYHLRTLAHVDGEANSLMLKEWQLWVPFSLQSNHDFHNCTGRFVSHDTLKRRPFIRFFACEEDLSLEPP